MTGEESAGSPVLRKLDDYEAMRELALQAGLEDGTFEDIITALGYFIGDELYGCVALKKDGERYSIDWLAVSEPFRRKGVGGMLVRRIEAEAKTRGAERVWALARAPKFFESVGFRVATSEESGGPTMSNCLLCSQYHRSCFPAVVVKDL